MNSSKRSMKRMLPLILILGAFVSVNAGAAVTLVDKDEWKVMFGGFVELDMMKDTTRSLTEVAGSTPIDRQGTVNGDTGRTQFSTRNSRFSFSVLPPVENEWKTKGYLEFDLLGYDPTPSAAAPTNSESSFATNPTLRLRHGYIGAEKRGYTVLAGQTWTLFGWAPLYVPTTASVPPVTGSVYSRTQQVTVFKDLYADDSNKLVSGISIVRPVQRDGQIPGLDAGLRAVLGGRKAGFVTPSGDLKAESMSFALSGTARNFVTQPAGGSTTSTVNHLASAFAINGMIPILSTANEKEYGNTLALSGEFTRGSGYGDEFAGFTGNIAQVNGTNNLDAGQGGFDSNGTFQLVKLQTWNTQLQYHLPSGTDTFVDLGYGQLRSTNIASLQGSVTPLKTAYDRSEVYFANVFHDVTRHLRVAAELDHFTTRYVDGVRTQDNRIQLSSFIRF